YATLALNTSAVRLLPAWPVLATESRLASEFSTAKKVAEPDWASWSVTALSIFVLLVTPLSGAVAKALPEYTVARTKARTATRVARSIPPLRLRVDMVLLISRSHRE